MKWKPLVVDSNVNGGNNNLKIITVNELTEHPPLPGTLPGSGGYSSRQNSLCFGEAYIPVGQKDDKQR